MSDELNHVRRSLLTGLAGAGAGVALAATAASANTLSP